jgi:hypothetical protein
MKLVGRYDFDENGNLVGYQMWDADRIPPPSEDYIEQAPPADMLLTKPNGDYKYKKDENSPKKWTDKIKDIGERSE